jgi:hypothetical protein
MTQDEIIKMASKVDLSPVFQIYPRELENFVKLVEKNELERMREVFRVALLDAKKRKWVGLTKKDLQQFAKSQYGWEDLCLAVEAKLKQKNEQQTQ